MKKMVGLIISGIIIIVLGTVAIRSCSKKAVENFNVEIETTVVETTNHFENTVNDLGMTTECTEDNVGNVVSALMHDAPTYWDEAFISNNFNKKYRCANDICPDSSNWTFVGAGKREFDGKSIISINGFSKDYYSEEHGCNIQQTTACYYDYVINDNNQLDDLVFISKKVYPEIVAITGERLDGKKEAKPDRVSELLHYIANPYHDFDFVYTHNYSEEAMPYSDICKIVNRPDLDKLGVPDNSYDEKKGDDVYIVFEYPDWKVTWKVNYKVNDDLFFDYIEYIEVDE